MAEQTAVGRERLQSAQEAAGLSNEKIARLIGISEKTWRRWKVAGEVPTPALPRVASALGLELTEAPARFDLLDGGGEDSGAVPPSPQQLGRWMKELLLGQQEALAVLGKLEEMLGERVARPRARQARARSRS